MVDNQLDGWYSGLPLPFASYLSTLHFFALTIRVFLAAAMNICCSVAPRTAHTLHAWAVTHLGNWRRVQ